MCLIFVLPHVCIYSPKDRKASVPKPAKTHFQQSSHPLIGNLCFPINIIFFLPRLLPREFYFIYYCIFFFKCTGSPAPPALPSQAPPHLLSCFFSQEFYFFQITWLYLPKSSSVTFLVLCFVCEIHVRRNFLKVPFKCEKQLVPYVGKPWCCQHANLNLSLFFNSDFFSGISLWF